MRKGLGEGVRKRFMGVLESLFLSQNIAECMSGNSWGGDCWVSNFITPMFWFRGEKWGEFGTSQGCKIGYP